MNDAGRSSHVPSITARPSIAEKRSFAELAAKRGMSESELALIAIRHLLASEGESLPPCSELVRAPATDRITIRLRPGDARIITERAARRGMKASTYLAALVRAHTARNPPLAAQELAMLKQAVMALGVQGRNLTRLNDALRSTGSAPPELADDLLRTRRLVALVEESARDLAVAALESWESGYA